MPQPGAIKTCIEGGCCKSKKTIYSLVPQEVFGNATDGRARTVHNCCAPFNRRAQFAVPSPQAPVGGSGMNAASLPAAAGRIADVD